MDNTCQEQEELIKMDIKNETINDTLIDLRTQIKFLRNQNDSIKMIIEEEVWSCIIIIILYFKINHVPRN